METCPREGVVKEERFPNIKKPSLQRVCGEFCNLRGQHKREGKKKKKKKKNKKLQNTRLTTTLGGEVAQMLVLATSEQGLNREVLVACLG